ncbi:MAG: alpha/beta fold hydrolase, partial [Paracoccaceae bacterium]
MVEVLLVHGSCHGAWCWHRVIPALAALGVAARAIDLPAHGADRTPAAGASLSGYGRAILAALNGPTL